MLLASLATFLSEIAVGKTDEPLPSWMLTLWLAQRAKRLQPRAEGAKATDALGSQPTKCLPRPEGPAEGEYRKTLVTFQATGPDESMTQGIAMLILGLDSFDPSGQGKIQECGPARQSMVQEKTRPPAEPSSFWRTQPQFLARFKNVALLARAWFKKRRGHPPNFPRSGERNHNLIPANHSPEGS